MRIVYNGTAIIEHVDTGQRYEIDPEEFDWDAGSGGDRSMGEEILHVGSLSHEILGDISHTISEYPLGMQNHETTDVGRHKVIKDFDIFLEHEPEYDENTFPAPEDLYKWLKNDKIWRNSLTETSLVEYLVQWFHYYYEDPANSVSYNTREGGYLWVMGGPYYAEEELRENFEGIVSENVISKAVEIIQADGLFDWAPSHNHPNRKAIDDQDDVHYDLGALTKQASATKNRYYESTQEAFHRSKILEVAAELKVVLPEPLNHGGLGHNQPPEEYALKDEEVVELAESLEQIEAELTNVEPSIETVLEKTNPFVKALKWAGKKADLTIEEFCKSFGAELGKVAAKTLIYGGGIFGATYPFWDKIASFYVAVIEWASIVLGLV